LDPFLRLTWLFTSAKVPVVVFWAKTMPWLIPVFNVPVHLLVGGDGNYMKIYGKYEIIEIL
jgi:hypothetical protein